MTKHRLFCLYNYEQNHTFFTCQQSHHDRNSPEGASRNFDGPSLLDGDYSEADNAAAFKAALNEWRTGKPEAPATRPSPRPTPRPAYSPVRTPSMSDLYTV